MKTRHFIRLRRIVLLIAAILTVLATGCGSASAGTQAKAASSGKKSDSGAKAEAVIDENGTYTSKDDVALYIHTYGHLPDNFISKKEAQKLGWSGGSLKDYAPGKSIGGSRFGNYEGTLPEKKGRQYYECDIDYKGKSRGAKRIVYSDDGLIFYTEDHYETFEQLY